jgi:hypothetical protein
MKFIKVTGGYFLKLEKGEEIISTITDFVAKQNIPGGALWGIGAITDVTIGYFSGHEKKYYKQTFSDEYELLSLSGSISYIESKPIIHAHIIISKTDYSLTGGHCFSAKVAVTTEIFIHTFEQKLNRAMDTEIGLNLLKF